MQQKQSRRLTLRPRLTARPVRRLYRAFQEFFRLEAAGGVVLLAAALIALVWANSPWAETYARLWHTHLGFNLGSVRFDHDLHWWINETLMVVFFFVVGLEIKREVLVGELSSVRRAALPAAAAIGGMVVPALLYSLINAQGLGARGWGVPMATDIAFTLGIMALLGPRLPIGLKIFVTALAIVDDIGAVVVIALFYTGQVNWIALGAAGLIFALLLACNFAGMRSLALYSILGIGLWLAILESGLHATLAGVLLALAIPASSKIRVGEFSERAHHALHEFRQAGEGRRGLLTSAHLDALEALDETVQHVETPLQRMEHSLHPWVTYGIIPLFALANAGVAVGGNIGATLSDLISLGVIAGLVLGKPLGIGLAAYLTIRLGLGDLPEGVNWRLLIGAGCLAGIGFTMSIFIAGLAFIDTPGENAAKAGILAASLLAGLIGYLLLRMAKPQE